MIMMHFSSFFSLSLIIFVFYSSAPSFAATLSAFPVKCGRILDPIKCYGYLPDNIPPQFPRFPDVLHMCAIRAGYPHNLECRCYGGHLICGFSSVPIVKSLIAHCRKWCGYPHPVTTEFFSDDQITEKFTYYDTIANFEPAHTNSRSPGTGGSRAHVAHSNSFAGNPNACTGSTVHTCSKTCTSVNHRCPWAANGDCKCFAPPVNLFY